MTEIDPPTLTRTRTIEKLPNLLGEYKWLRLFFSDELAYFEIVGPVDDDLNNAEVTLIHFRIDLRVVNLERGFKILIQELEAL